MIVSQDGRYHVNPRRVEYVEVSNGLGQGMSRVVLHMASGHALVVAEQKPEAARRQAEMISDQVENAVQRMELVGDES